MTIAKPNIKRTLRTIFPTIFRLLALKEITLRKVVNFSDKQKKLVYKLKYAFFTCFILFITFQGFGQELPIYVQDSIPVPEIYDIEPIDSIQVDTAQARMDTTIVVQPQGDIKTTIKYSARDSIVTSFTGNIVQLYGDAQITYGDIQLNAAEIEINWETNLLTANSITDSLGKKEGVPVFKQGADTYETQTITYNLKTRKALISGIVTQKDEGYIHGERVKKNERDELFVSAAKYTTCNLEHPHFYISAKKLKMIPDDKIVSGPFNLVINDIPTPLLFPFGIFPSPRKSASGVVIPTYGEENQRGFFLRDGGYYFDISEYINLTVLGEIYTKGGRGFRVMSDYRKRYAYNGSLNFHYNKRLSGREGDDSESNDFRIQWSHSPQSRKNSRFSASVNAASSTYNNNNILPGDGNINTTMSSSINYSQTFPNSPFSLSMSARHNQNLRTGEVNVLFPELSFNVNRQYPFQNVGRKQGWLQKISVGYSLNGKNELTNKGGRTPGFRVANPRTDTDTIKFNLDNLPLMFRQGQNGFRHNIPISTSTKLLRFFTLSPSLNFNQLFYFKELDYTFVESMNAIRIDTVNKFSTAYTYDVSAAISTRMYGTFFFKGGNVQAIRHVVTPSISFGYSPNFGDPKYGYYQEVRTDANDPTKTRMLSRHEGFAYGSPALGERASMSFSLNNNIEMKVRDKQAADTAKQQFKKVPLLENLSLSSGYNFLADSFKLSNISMRARTRLFNNKLDVSVGGTLDPYIYRIDSMNTAGRVIRQRRVDEFAWNTGRGFGQFTNASLALSTNFNPAARDKQNERVNTATQEATTPEEEEHLAYIAANPDLYVEWDVPWSLRVSYNLSYSKRGFMESNITQSLQFSGDVSLTEKWKIGFSSGYDFVRHDLTQTNLNIHRDLHCWEMRVTWIPFGRFQSYSLNINVKASILQDLKLSRRRNFVY